MKTQDSSSAKCLNPPHESSPPFPGSYFQVKNDQARILLLFDFHFCSIFVCFLFCFERERTKLGASWVAKGGGKDLGRVKERDNHD